MNTAPPPNYRSSGVPDFNWDRINSPTALHEIDVFENLNKISAMVRTVLGWDEVMYLRKPKTKHEKAVQIFYHAEHYSAVRKNVGVDEKGLWE